ncbi:MAG: hypothetical protein AB7O79_13360 [Xanthobacteraceae bacterium]
MERTNKDAAREGGASVFRGDQAGRPITAKPNRRVLNNQELSDRIIGGILDRLHQCRQEGFCPLCEAPYPEREYLRDVSLRSGGNDFAKLMHRAGILMRGGSV